MENNILNIKNAKEFRAWLINNHDTANEFYLELKRGKPKDDGNFYYIDAIYEALCFGFIDSTLKRKDGKLLQRFSKRVSKEYTELNKQRLRYLLANNKIDESIIHDLPDLDISSYKIDEQIKKVLMENNVYDNLMQMEPLYIRIRTSNLLFYFKKDKKLYEKALANCIKYTKDNKYYGIWNDYGRLSSK